MMTKKVMWQYLYFASLTLKALEIPNENPKKLTDPFLRFENWDY